ncbi:MAG: ribosome maturation factor RimM [Thalassobaculales bacterium]
MPSPILLPGHVCLAAITGAHGVRGVVRLRPFGDDPAAMFGYGAMALVGPDGTLRATVRPVLVGEARDQLLVRLPGVADRDAAEALRGATLQLPRAALPAPDDDEWYHADLIGLAAEAPDGRPLGTVVGVHDFGAGTLLEVAGQGPSRLFPFTRAVVPVIDAAGGRLVIEEPLETDPGEEEAAA